MFKNAHPDLVIVARDVGISPQNRRLQQWFNPHYNRWTGKPHEHKREIARRLRQAKAQA